MEREFVLVDKEEVADCHFPMEEVLKSEKEKKALKTEISGGYSPLSNWRYVNHSLKFSSPIKHMQRLTGRAEHALQRRLVMRPIARPVPYNPQLFKTEQCLGKESNV